MVIKCFLSFELTFGITGGITNRQRTTQSLMWLGLIIESFQLQIYPR